MSLVTPTEKAKYKVGTQLICNDAEDSWGLLVHNKTYYVVGLGADTFGAELRIRVSTEKNGTDKYGKLWRPSRFTIAKVVKRNLPDWW